MLTTVFIIFRKKKRKHKYRIVKNLYEGIELINSFRGDDLLAGVLKLVKLKNFFVQLIGCSIFLDQK